MYELPTTISKEQCETITPYISGLLRVLLRDQIQDLSTSLEVPFLSFQMVPNSHAKIRATVITIGPLGSTCGHHTVDLDIKITSG